MELRHIRYFLAVAEEGNFTRAAARLGIAQPPLSLQIKDLEAEVDALLFHRVPHGAELTEAGRAFRAVVRAIPERATEAVRSARRAARGEIGQLALGFTGSAALNPVVPASIRAFRRTFPEVGLRLTEANSVALVEGLLEGSLDIAIVRPTGSDPEALKLHVLVDEPLVVALPLAHAEAAGEAALDLARLRDEPLVLTPRAIGTSLHDAALAACRAAGFEPSLGQPAPQIASILALVAAELGFSLVPASMRQLGVAGVAYRDIRAPAPRVALAIGHRKSRPAAVAGNFVGLARRAAGSP